MCATEVPQHLPNQSIPWTARGPRSCEYRVYLYRQRTSHSSKDAGLLPPSTIPSNTVSPPKAYTPSLTAHSETSAAPLGPHGLLDSSDVHTMKEPGGAGGPRSGTRKWWQPERRESMSGWALQYSFCKHATLKYLVYYQWLI